MTGPPQGSWYWADRFRGRQLQMFIHECGGVFWFENDQSAKCRRGVRRAIGRRHPLPRQYSTWVLSSRPTSPSYLVWRVHLGLSRESRMFSANFSETTIIFLDINQSRPERVLVFIQFWRLASKSLGAVTNHLRGSKVLPRGCGVRCPQNKT